MDLCEIYWICIFRDLQVDEDDVMEDSGVVGDMTLEELYPGDRDHVLHAEVLVQCPDASPLPP